MPDHELLYAVLFEAVTEAIGQLEAQNYGQAREILQRAQARGMQACLPDPKGSGVYPPFRTPAVLYANRRPPAAPGWDAGPPEDLSGG